MATTTKKRVAKNRKKAWRKHTDIKDVEEFLEDQRMQMRTGGLVTEKSNQELFFVDTKLADNSNKKQQKRVREKKPLKCHQHLYPNPNTKPAPRANPCGGKESLEEKLVGKKVKKIVKSNANKGAEPWDKTASSQAAYNIWDDGDEQERKSNSVAGKKKRKGGQLADDPHYMTITKKARVKVPATYRDKPSTLPAVAMVAPGSSYNPAYEDHQRLLRKVLKKEEKRLATEKKLDRQLRKPPPHLRATTESDLTEWSQGLFEQGEEEESGSEGVDHQSEEGSATHVTDAGQSESCQQVVVVAGNAPTRPEQKKSKKQRRKEKERRIREQISKEKKLKKVQLHDVFKLKTLKKEIANKERASSLKKERRAKRKKNDLNKTKKLGAHRYEEPLTAFQLTSELTGSLRTLKPVGCLFQDRFKGYQKRNILEPLIKYKAHKSRFKKYKYYEKNDYKEIRPLKEDDDA